MKENKIIIILILCIVIVLGIDIIFVINKNLKKEEKIKYNCKGSITKHMIENPNSVYQRNSSYEFYVTSANEIESGYIITEFAFEKEEDYNNFLEKVDNKSEERIKEYDKENLKIVYTFSNTFPNVKEENKFYYTEDYLKQMEEKGFYCEKIG